MIFLIIWQSLKQIYAFWLVLSLSGFCSKNRYNGNGPSCILVFLSKAGIFKICNQTTKKAEHWHFFFFSETTTKSWNNWKFTKISKTDEEDEHSLSEFYHPEDLQTLDAETQTRNAFPYNKPFTDWALGPSVTALGLHCHDLPLNNVNYVNFILAELSGAHCKQPKQEHEQSERENFGCQVICGDPSSAVLDKTMKGF